MQGNKRSKLTNKLILLIGTVGVSILLIIEVFTYDFIRTLITKDIKEEITLNTKVAEDKISSIFEQNARITEQMAINMQITDYLQGVNTREDIITHPLFDSVKTTLGEVKKSYPLLEDVWIAKYDPSFSIIHNGDVSGENFKASNKLWYDIANSSDEVVFTEPTESTNGNQLMISGIKSLSDTNGKKYGVVCVDISLDNITEIMQGVTIGENGKAILVSSSGKYVYTDEESKIIKENATDDPILKSYVEAALNGKSDVTKIDYNGTNYYLQYEPIGVNGWAILSFADQKEVMSIMNKYLLIMLLVLLGSSTIAISIIRYIISKNMKPIEEATHNLEVIAEGDFTVDISEKNTKRKDEIGALTKSTSKILKNFNILMTNINSASEQVTSGARQVSDASTSLSQGTTEQASAVEELTATIQRINSQTKNNAENAEEAKNIAEKALYNVQDGQAKMGDMLNAMGDINSSSQDISKIIKVIDEIAFQTNILALNAAVEAARAVQHGKGFAVVAEEVRNLAARSAEAAKETTELIQNSMDKVDGGTKIASNTSDALNEIVKEIESAAKLVVDIAQASNEQAVSVNQVTKGISQISDVVQATSATSEQTAASSEELESQAEMLKEMVNKVKLKNVESKVDAMQEINPEILIKTI